MVFLTLQDPSCDRGAESVPDSLLRSQGSGARGWVFCPSDRLSQISGSLVPWGWLRHAPWPGLLISLCAHEGG